MEDNGKVKLRHVRNDIRKTYGYAREMTHESEGTAVYRDPGRLRKHDPGGQKAEHHTASPILLSGRGGEQPGLSLFERTGKALRPTYLGELYLEKARKILALGEEFQQQREQVLHAIRPDPGGIPIRRSPHLIPSALKIFRSRFPNVEVVVQEGNQRAMTEMLRRISWT